jgi:spermidine/putrescine transport system substrate-binding protein
VIEKATTRWPRVALAFCSLGAVLALAACGDSGIESDSGGGEVQTATAEGEPQGDLTISNWPFYIDNQTVADFEKASGISVKYIEDVNDNAEFFGKVQPLLSKGESGGRSLFVVTDWMAKKMYDLGYLQNFDKSAVEPAFANLTPSLQHPDFDPDRDFSLPWQSGMAGLIVNTDLAPDVRSIADLFDPQYKGNVEMLTELRDTVPLVMKSMGIDADDPSEEDWMAAIDRIREAVDAGQIRRFTGNDYTRDLANGDAAAIIGWSGDAVQLQADNPEIEFRMPTEGCVVFSDDMVIPVGAPNPTAAYAWMNYVYEPKNQAQIAAYNSYFTPVVGVKEIFERTDPELAKSQLIFPTDQYLADCSYEPDLTGEEEQRVTREFEGLLSG